MIDSSNTIQLYILHAINTIIILDFKLVSLKNNSGWIIIFSVTSQGHEKDLQLARYIPQAAAAPDLR